MIKIIICDLGHSRPLGLVLEEKGSRPSDPLQSPNPIIIWAFCPSPQVFLSPLTIPKGAGLAFPHTLAVLGIPAIPNKSWIWMTREIEGCFIFLPL